MIHERERDSTWLFRWLHWAKKEPKCVCFHKTSSFHKVTHGGAAVRRKAVWYSLCNMACLPNRYLLSVLHPGATQGQESSSWRPGTSDGAFSCSCTRAEGSVGVWTLLWGSSGRKLVSSHRIGLEERSTQLCPWFGEYSVCPRLFCPRRDRIAWTCPHHALPAAWGQGSLLETGHPPPPAPKLTQQPGPGPHYAHRRGHAFLGINSNVSPGDFFP